MTKQNFSALLLNLDRDTTRLAHMEKQLANANITFVRQPGILGDDLPDDLRSSFFDESGNAKTTMKRGELGCYASHLRALKRVESGELGNVVLIMEDDLDITPNLIALIDEAQNATHTVWDIIRLSNPPRRAYAPLAQLADGRFLVRYSKIPTSAGAYLITPAGAQKFLEQGIRGLTFDDDLRRPWFHQMDTYGIVPPPISAGVLHSSIDAVEPGRFEKGMSSRQERLMRGDHRHLFKRMFYNIENMGPADWLLCNIVNCADMIFKPLLGHSIIDKAVRLFPLEKKNEKISSK